jgi:hypothetical protein
MLLRISGDSIDADELSYWLSELDLGDAYGLTQRHEPE